MTKECRKCKLEKSLEDFSPNKRARDGLQYSCKVCGNKATRKRRLETNGLCVVYHSMRARCLNKNNPLYRRYGGRGIIICKEWLDSFDLFYEWAKTNGHTKGLTIDRTNNDGNYEPSNCRWVTSEINTQNSSRAKLNAEKVREIKQMLKEGKLQKDIAEIYNINHSSVYMISINKRWKNIT